MEAEALSCGGRIETRRSHRPSELLGAVSRRDQGTDQKVDTHRWGL